MSFGIDVNILLYASDESSPLHDKAAAFLQQCVGSREVFCLAWITVMSYLRKATHPSLFNRPLSHEDSRCTCWCRTCWPPLADTCRSPNSKPVCRWIVWPIGARVDLRDGDTLLDAMGSTPQ
jgi:hypothetical protein